MLVLSRRLGQRIFLGDSIVLQVTDLDRDRVRIGIEAPPHVPIYREEVAPRDHPALAPPPGPGQVVGSTPQEAAP